jgi:hypothetical protein
LHGFGTNSATNPHELPMRQWTPRMTSAGRWQYRLPNVVVRGDVRHRLWLVGALGTVNAPAAALTLGQHWRGATRPVAEGLRRRAARRAAVCRRVDRARRAVPRPRPEAPAGQHQPPEKDAHRPLGGCRLAVPGPRCQGRRDLPRGELHAPRCDPRISGDADELIAQRALATPGPRRCSAAYCSEQPNAGA